MRDERWEMRDASKRVSVHRRLRRFRGFLFPYPSLDGRVPPARGSSVHLRWPLVTSSRFAKRIFNTLLPSCWPPVNLCWSRGGFETRVLWRLLTSSWPPLHLLLTSTTSNDLDCRQRKPKRLRFKINGELDAEPFVDFESRPFRTSVDFCWLLLPCVDSCSWPVLTFGALSKKTAGY